MKGDRERGCCLRLACFCLFFPSLALCLDRRGGGEEERREKERRAPNLTPSILPSPSPHTLF